MDINQRIQDHIQDKNNPHGTTKDDIPGLENIHDYPVATKEIAESGESDVHYVTPRRLKDVFNGHLKRQGLMDDAGNPILPDQR